MEELIKRYNELYERAVSNYLNKTDFNVLDWLSGNEVKEFVKIETELEL